MHQFVRPAASQFAVRAMVTIAALLLLSATGTAMAADSPRERISINDDWRFTKGDPPNLAENLAYPRGRRGNIGACAHLRDCRLDSPYR